MNEAELIARVMKEDAEYSQLVREHQSLERELKELEAARFPSVQQEMRIREIKKQKLAKKDMMARIIERYKALSRAQGATQGGPSPVNSAAKSEPANK
ncbi:MAG: YdcH family protein [Nitrospinota bacterium]